MASTKENHLPRLNVASQKRPGLRHSFEDTTTLTQGEGGGGMICSGYICTMFRKMPSKYAQAILSSVSSKIVATHSGPVTKVFFYALSIGLLFGTVASLPSWVQSPVKHWQYLMSSDSKASFFFRNRPRATHPSRDKPFQEMLRCERQSFVWKTKDSMHVIGVAHKAGFLTWQTQSNLHVRPPSHLQQNLHQEVYSPPHNNSAIIDTVYLTGIGTSSLSPNISLS